MSRSRGTQRMSPGSPQDGHSQRDTSNSSSASSIKMPELVTSSSDSNGSFRNNTKNSPNFSSRMGSRRTGTKELLTPHRHEDKWHKGCQLFPPRQEKEKARLPKCHHRCALMHPPCIDGGSWMQCKSQCQDKHDHNGRHNCYGGCHNQPYM